MSNLQISLLIILGQVVVTTVVLVLNYTNKMSQDITRLLIVSTMIIALILEQMV